MSVAPPALSIAGSEGELILIRVAVSSRLLEDLLETLANLDYPINPQIYHPANEGQGTVVEFPAYETWIDEVKRALHYNHVPAKVSSRRMIDELSEGGAMLYCA